MLTRIDYVGDNKRYEACTTDDSRMMVVVDTTVEETQLQELRAKQFAAIVQKMRKTGAQPGLFLWHSSLQLERHTNATSLLFSSLCPPPSPSLLLFLSSPAGLSVGDKVEIFYGCTDPKDEKAFKNALHSFKEYTINKLKTLPLLAKEYLPKYARVILKESHKDADLSSKPFTITLTIPTISVSQQTLTTLVGGDTDASSTAASTLAHYLQTCDLQRFKDGESDALELKVDDMVVSMKMGEHFFLSAKERADAEE